MRVSERCSDHSTKEVTNPSTIARRSGRRNREATKRRPQKSQKLAMKCSYNL